MPESTQLINTPLNLRICRIDAHAPVGKGLQPWIASMEQAIETGATFSAAFPLTSTADANRHGQKYHGPVVLIIDARCYSAGDAFSAGFQDHEIGDVLGVDANTGAGGANVWKHRDFWTRLESTEPDLASPYQVLPGGAAMRVSFRRLLRVGKLAGALVEDYGVAANVRHAMTLDDLLHENVDLLERAAALLQQKPAYALAVTQSADTGGTVTLTIEASANLESADIYVDGRPHRTVMLAGEPERVTLTGSTQNRTVKVQAFDGSALAAARTLTVPKVAEGPDGFG